MGNAVPDQDFPFLMNFSYMKSAYTRLVLALRWQRDVNFHWGAFKSITPGHLPIMCCCVKPAP